jgi:glutamate synthase (NADPH/NADH) small chain
MSNPQKRVSDFSEVQQPYTLEQAIEEARRCLLCGTPVCIDACPVQMDVRGMCEAVSRNDLPTAYRRIRETNALLGVTARCCPQLQGLCEDACVMRWAGEPISIGMIQRFVADWEQKTSPQPDPACANGTGKRVTIVGAGPAGLAAAELLTRYGHSVKIYDELPFPGGTAWYGIPDYHLPKDVLAYEIDRIKKMGIAIKSGVKVGKDITLSQILSDEADCVLITTGAWDPIKLDTPGIDLQGIYDAYSFLRSVFINGVENYLKNPEYDLGKKIVVIGGGDSALDAARTSKRLTQGDVTIFYRRTENEMPSDPIMLQEAKDEGVQFKFLADPKKYLGSNGRVSKVLMSTMQLGQPDESGRRKPIPVEGKDFEVECSSVILAVGRGPNTFLSKQAALKTGKKGAIDVDDRFRTSMSNVFAAGDVTTGETLVVKAMGSGREAAQRVHEYLMGIEDKHVSLYERYFVQRSFEAMESGSDKSSLPPP